MNKLLGSGFTAGLLIAVSAAAQHSVWLPESQRLVVTPSYVYQTFDEFWKGEDKMPLAGDLWQHTALLGFDYGISEDTALDLTLGWVWSETDSPMLGATTRNLNDDGLTDTTFGVRQRFIDETDFDFWWLPSLAVRAGGIIEGTYDENFPFSAGDGASGAEASLLGGKSICPGFGWYGDVGYRYRDGDVPDEWFGAAGLFFSWKFLSLTGGYRFVESLSGNDIEDALFMQRMAAGKPAFPLVKEVSQNVEVAFGVTDPGGRYYQIFYAHTFDGLNTGMRDIFGGAISLTW